MMKQTKQAVKRRELRERREANERIIKTMGLGKAKTDQPPAPIIPKTGTLVYMFEWKRRRERIKALLASIDKRMDELTALSKESPN